MGKKKSKIKKKNKKLHDARAANGTQNKKRLKDSNFAHGIANTK